MNKFTFLLLFALFSCSFVFAESFTQLPVIDLSKQSSLTITSTNTSGNESGFIQITPPQYTPNISKVTFYSVDSFWALLGLSLYPVDTNLNVGIGTATPTAKLTVVGTQGLIAAGTSASATGNQSIAVGLNANASGANSFAVGSNANSVGDYSFSLGYASNSTATQSIVLGTSSLASGVGSRSIGNNVIASGPQSTAIGFLTKASAPYATAIGELTTASGITSTAFGHQTTASGTQATSFGVNTLASGSQSTAFGSATNASGMVSTAFGFQTRASGNYAIAMGSQIIVLGNNSVGIGLSDDSNNVTGNNVFAVLGGNVGIGTGAPSGKLIVLGDSAVLGDAPWALRVFGGKGNLIENTSNKAGSGGSLALVGGLGGDGAGSGGSGGSIYLSGGQGGYADGKGGNLYFSSGLPSPIPPISGSAGDIYLSAGNVSFSGETQTFYPNGKIVLGSRPIYFTLSPQGILINGTINSTGDICIIGGPCLSSVTSGSGARATISAPAVVGTSGSTKVYAVSATQFFNSSKGFSCQQFCASKGRTTSCTGADDVTTLLSVTNTCADVNLNDKYCACVTKYILK